MNLGNKIAKLRKDSNLSQEDLAEKVGVTRQTISKWKLEETSPDINQVKKLSNIFKISLDELVNNDINNILIKKISNTEKLSEIILKGLKIAGKIGIIYLIFICILIIFTILYAIFH